MAAVFGMLVLLKFKFISHKSLDCAAQHQIPAFFTQESLDSINSSVVAVGDKSGVGRK